MYSVIGSFSIFFKHFRVRCLCSLAPICTFEVHTDGDGTQLGVQLFLIHLWAPKGAHRQKSICARLHLGSVQPLCLEEIIPDSLEIIYAKHGYVFVAQISFILTRYTKLEVSNNGDTPLSSIFSIFFWVCPLKTILYWLAPLMETPKYVLPRAKVWLQILVQEDWE